MFESRRNITKQLFQLAYFGKVSPEFASGLETSERNYLYQLLKEQLESEKREHEKEAAKVKSKTPSMPSRLRGR